MANYNSASVGTIAHMTHIKNFEGILAHGLLAHDNPYQEVDISNVGVNQRRMQCEPVYHRPIHDYVPFYYNPRNAMLYRNEKHHGDNVILLGFSRDLIHSSGVVFANANASCASTVFSGSARVLDTYNWDRIFSQSWYRNGSRDDALKREMMAEVLLHERVSCDYLEVIYCNSTKMKNFIESNYTLGEVRVLVKKEEFFC